MIAGNYIGMNVDGTKAVGNANGVYLTHAASNVIGGASAGDRNVVSGNTGDGIYLGAGSSNVVANDYIGVTADGLVHCPTTSASGSFPIRVVPRPRSTALMTTSFPATPRSASTCSTIKRPAR